MSGNIKARNEIKDEYKWKLEDMYENEKLWEDDFKSCYKLIEEISDYRGRLGEDAKTLLSCLNLRDKLSSTAMKVFAYARMHRDEDNRSEKYQSMTDRAQSLSADVAEKTSFLTPEILQIGKDKLEGFINSEEGLKTYKFMFDDLLRQSEHTLSVEEERILAAASIVAESPSDIFDMWNNADISFGTVIDEDGNEKELTQGNYISFLHCKDRTVRENAFKAMYKQYKAFENTLACAYNGNVKADSFYAKMRKYDSCLEMSLSDDNINTKVYHNLIEVMDKNLPALKKYLELRKKVLKLEKLNMYDVYTPLVSEKNKDIPYEDACEIVLKALAPLGDEYVSQVKDALDSGWVDVYETKGKTPGAYSWGCNDTHPFVLLNYQNTLNDVFTLAHELGHAMHSYYTNTTQPDIYKNYCIFVAEVASTVNENLLMEYLIENTDDNMMRAYLINHKLEGIRTTVYRQTMFAEFEMKAHEMYEKGEPLTANSLFTLYKSLNDKYFAPIVDVDDEIGYEWSRIPHFYSSFYVYQYATGYCAAATIADKILSGDEGAKDKYIEFLKSGSSDYPITLLKKTGVDLETTAPIQRTLDIFSKTVDELGEIIITKDE